MVKKNWKLTAKDPLNWSDGYYVEMQKKSHQIKVKNVHKERGIAVIQKFKSSITKCER